MSHPQFSIQPNPTVPYQCLYEDHDLLIINKPAGIVTQPGVRHEYDSLLNGLFQTWGKALQNLGKKRDYGLLHRLDRGTSGLVVVGLSIAGYEGMLQLFKQRQIEKTYLGLIRGCLKPAEGRCTWPIEERRIQGKKRAYVYRKLANKNSSGSLPRYKRQGGQKTTQKNSRVQKAITSYQTLSSTKEISLVQYQIQTGRLHQIRAHMSTLGHPIIGDFDYGGKHPLNLTYRNFDRGNHALHASRLRFIHPCTQNPLSFNTPLPQRFIEMTTLFNLSLPPM